MSKTKSIIIDVAKELFQKISVNKVTMNDIAEEAKMSRRTLYTHFKSKEELYNFVIEDQINGINERLQKAADSHLAPNRKLKLYILQHFAIIDNLVSHNRYLRYDFLFDNRNIERLRKNIDHKEIELLTGILKAGKREGLFKIQDPAEFAKVLLMMFKSLEQAFIIAQSKAQNSAAILEYVNIMFYGIINKDIEAVRDPHRRTILDKYK